MNNFMNYPLLHEVTSNDLIKLIKFISENHYFLTWPTLTNNILHERFVIRRESFSIYGIWFYFMLP